MSMRRRQFIAGVAGSVAFPLAGRALPANVPVVGVLSFNSAGPMMASRIDGFLRGLSELHRSEEHTSELQSLRHLVCRLLLEKKKTRRIVGYFTLTVSK